MTGRNATPYLRAGNIGEDGLDLSEVFEMDFTPDEREKYALRAGDVVLAEGSGSATHVGRPAVWRDELPLCCIQNTVIRFRPHATTPKYALAVFRHYVASGVFARTARGIGLLHLGARRFGELRFPLPPLAEQQRITGVLEAKLDDLRKARLALESALSGTHEQDREILAAATTGNLLAGPDGGRARKRPQTTGGASGTDQPTLSERHPVPDDWEWMTVGAVGELTLGKTLGSAHRRGPHIKPYLRVANVLEDRIDFSDLKKMPFSDTELEKYALRDGDILLNEGQSPELVGRPAMYHAELPELYYQNHLIRFRADERIHSAFALLVFRHYLHAGEFRRLARGSTNIANLSRTRLASMPFPVPPLPEQKKLAAEAHRRLTLSAEQRTAITSSLENAKTMAAELLRAAVLGQLVEQDPADEPAPELLVRLGPPPDHATARVGRVRRKQSTTSSVVKKPWREHLVSILSESDRPLTLPEICRAAEVDINDVGEIEDLYSILHAELGRSLRIAHGQGEAAALEVISSAS
jgi:type I restriction enzyme S subunit